MREGVAEGGDRLDGRVGELADRVVLVETEEALYLIHCRVLLYLDCVRVQVLDVVSV